MISTHEKSDTEGRSEGPSLADALGIRDDFAPDFMAPPVDRDLVARFVRCELSGADREQVTDLIAAFRPWRLALRAALGEEAGRAGGVSPGPSGE